MAKYAFQASYTPDGVSGLLKEGGSKRREAVAQAVKGLGGTLEAFYYAFGEADVIAIADMPDNVSTTAFSLTVSAGAGATVKTIVLITPEEVDQAVQRSVQYRAPGR
jgi:uncharacterized protein with GYD domain